MQEILYLSFVYRELHYFGINVDPRQKSSSPKFESPRREAESLHTVFQRSTILTRSRAVQIRLDVQKNIARQLDDLRSVDSVRRFDATNSHSDTPRCR